MESDFFFEPKKNLVKTFGKYSCSRKLQIISHNLASFQVLLLVNFYDNDLIELDLPWSCPLSEEVHGGSKTFSFYLYTTLCIQFLDRENNDKNNTLPLGIQICFIIVWGCAEILPFIFLKRITQHYSLHHQQIKNSIVAFEFSRKIHYLTREFPVKLHMGMRCNPQQIRVCTPSLSPGQLK